MQFYRVKNWQRFQHYKDRNPPWIKLHYEIMTSSDWVMLADASKLLAIVCMMIASRNDGKVPADPNYLKRVAYLDKLPDFKPLLKCGFLEILLADASDCKQLQADARPETEAYSTEAETEVEIVAARVAKPDWLPSELFSAFKDMRKSIKAPMSARAEELAIKRLDHFRLKGHDPTAVLEQSIRNSWKDIYELKGTTNENLRHRAERAVTKQDRARDAVMRAAIEGGFAPQE